MKCMKTENVSHSCPSHESRQESKSHVQLFATSWTIGHQASLMEFSRQYWSGFLGWEDPLEERIATHSSILAGKIPQTQEPGGLQSIEWQRDPTEVTEHGMAHIKYLLV